MLFWDENDKKFDAAAKKYSNISVPLTDPKFDLFIEKELSALEDDYFDTVPFWVIEDLAKHCKISIGDIYSVSFLEKKEGEPRRFEAELRLFKNKQSFKAVFFYESKRKIAISEILAVDPAYQTRRE